MNRTTKYEVYAKDNSIVDRDQFLDNLKKLSKVNNKAKELYNELLAMSSTFIDIPSNLTRENMLNQLDYYYGMFNSLFVSCTYHIILERFGYERDPNANVLNMKPVEDCIYKAYKEDYCKFISCMHELIENPMQWGFPFTPENKTEHKTIEELHLPISPFCKES